MPWNTTYAGRYSPRIGHSGLVRVSVDLGGRHLALYAIHPLGQVKRLDRWLAYTKPLTRELARDKGPRVVAGGFNTTQFNEWLSQLDDLGYHSVHEMLGHGLAFTWPNGMYHVPPIRIDHVLVAGPVAPLAVREGKGAGSDHRPVIVDLSVRS